MKTINNTVLLFIMAVVMAGVFSACSKEDLPNSGRPMIKYVRITAPESSDSLLVGAHQGQMIAIVGENLQEAREIWFNNQKALLTSTYITSTSILVGVPSPIPTEITNKLKIYFSGGDSLLYDFQVQISKPTLGNMVSEFVKTGEVATIRGDFFYEPLTVTFTGGATADVTSVTDKILSFTVPDAAQPGPITVKTNFGETESDFWFRDSRNLLITSDPWSGWWGQNLVINGSDPMAISGNFVRITQKIGAWQWTEFVGGKEDALATSKNIPDEAVLHPEKYNLKFEINTLLPFDGNRIKIMIGQVNGPDPNWDTEPYYWEPPYDTKGKWQTVVISFDEVVAHYANWGLRPQGYGVKVWFHGPGELDADIAFDNLRVVPKINK